ncbi:MAG: hypothetical protein ACYSUF_05515 [Planctomycetota bacterium]|jgi:hypothetical protein
MITSVATTDHAAAARARSLSATRWRAWTDQMSQTMNASSLSVSR